MDYNTLMNCVPSLPAPVTIDPHSLYAAFEQITDGRHKRGVRYPLAVLLSLIVLAKLSGETTPPRGGRVGTPSSDVDRRYLPLGPATLSMFLDLYLCAGETVS